MDKIYMRFPGGLKKTLTLSYDDGVEQDERLLSILKKNGLKVTFNLNSGLFVEEGHVFPEGFLGRRVTLNKALNLYNDSNVEVAVHTITHPNLIDLKEDEIRKEVFVDRTNLETMFNKFVRGMAYPFGDTNEEVERILTESGIVYSRTCVSTEKFDIPTNWLELPATCHHTNPRLMELAKEMIEANQEGEPMMFYLWGHAYEFERDNNWEVIENFASYIGHKEDIWYATNIEIYDYVKAFNSLLFSADHKTIYNPTCTTIYFRYKDMNYILECGEEITL